MSDTKRAEKLLKVLHEQGPIIAHSGDPDLRTMRHIGLCEAEDAFTLTGQPHSSMVWRLSAKGKRLLDEELARM